MPKLGYAERKTSAPQNIDQVLHLLGEIMSAAINNEVDLDNAKVALNAATRLVDVMQADTRMKALAIATNRQISKTGPVGLIQMEQTVND